MKALELDKGSKSGGEDAETDESSEEGNDYASLPTSVGPHLFMLSSSGRGKRISLGQFKQQTRAGRGKRAMGLLKGDTVAAMCVTGFEEGKIENVIVGSQNGVMNRYDVDSIRPQSGPSAKGVTLMKLGKGDTVSVLTLLPAELSEETEGEQ